MLVAVHHDVQPAVIPVAHGDKIGKQGFQVGGRTGAQNREIALVLFHHRNEHLVRQLEVRGVERAAQGGGRFDQVGHLGQQAGVVGDGAVHLRSQPGNLLLDAAAAFAFIQQDALFAEKIEIFVRRADGNFLRGAEAQPAGGVRRSAARRN